MFRFLKYLFQLIISPGRGWEDISAAGDDKEKVAGSGLYPMLAIASLSEFIRYFYDRSLTLVNLLQHAIITYVQYFISYFLALSIFSFFISKLVDGEPSEKKYATMIAYGLGACSLITIIENCLPVELSIVQFLPVYVALILWKGERYLAVRKDREVHFILLSILTVILLPVLIGIIFKLLIIR